MECRGIKEMTAAELRVSCQGKYNFEINQSTAGDEYDDDDGGGGAGGGGGRRRIRENEYHGSFIRSRNSARFSLLNYPARLHPRLASSVAPPVAPPSERVS